MANSAAAVVVVSRAIASILGKPTVILYTDEAVSYGLGIETSTFILGTQQIQPSSNNEKIVLSCPCYDGYLELRFFGDMGRA